MEILEQGRWSMILVQLLLVVCIAGVSTVIGQDGFLSIDCGSDESYHDNSTGIYWESDSNYILTGKNVKNISVPDNDTLLNRGQLTTVRFFDDPSSSRDCYVLPVQSGETYLVRATFFYGSLDSSLENASTSISFGFYLDNNRMASYGWDKGTANTDEVVESFEIIYSAPKSSLNACLIRLSPYSFISALEIRRLETGMYADALSSLGPTYLLMLYRINCGASASGAVQEWRYPDDVYDRLWSLSDDAIDEIRNGNLSDSSNSTAQNQDRPPPVVMQDAWTDSSTIEIMAQGDYPEDYSTTQVVWIYTALYVKELNGSDLVDDVRGMTFIVSMFDGIDLNTVATRSFNSSDEPAEIHAVSHYNGTLDNLNLTLSKANWSRLGPILNAYELYTLHAYSTWTTAAEDVSALSAVQASLNLQNWSGDPCLPNPFDWLDCTYDYQPRITNLSLAFQGLGGGIPLEIRNLTALTNLALNNNNFTGSIPDFSNLVHLQTIFLQNNSLSGEIPSYLGSALPNLTRLNLDNNNLSGPVPSNLYKTSLHFTDLNNPLITNSSTNVTFSSTGGSDTGAVVGGVLGGLAGVAMVTGIVWILCTRKRRARLNIIKTIEQAENQSKEGASIIRRALAGSLKLLTLQEVSDATLKFSKKLGEGSFGPVYYGKLESGQEVAVKVKSTESRQGVNEFLNEVELLSRIHHRNLVSLLACCEEENQQILIYAYVSNGTLRDHLYGDRSKVPLDWRTRLDIALNSARGLEYLHTDCNPRIIHRDVKSVNILIDEHMIAKVADFGISKQAPEGTFTGLDTLLKGTLGYFDPEYFVSQRLTPKSDVYSFGVVLLEIISGRHPHVSVLPDGTSGTLIQWLQAAVTHGSAMDIVDPSLAGEFNHDSMNKALSLAISCTNPLTAKRPDMSQVVHALTEAIDFEHSPETNLHTENSNSGTIPTIAEGSDEGQEDSVPLLSPGPGGHGSRVEVFYLDSSRRDHGQPSDLDPSTRLLPHPPKYSRTRSEPIYLRYLRRNSNQARQ